MLLLHLLLPQRFRPSGLTCCLLVVGFLLFDDVLQQEQITAPFGPVGLRPIALQLACLPAFEVPLSDLFLLLLNPRLDRGFVLWAVWNAVASAFLFGFLRLFALLRKVGIAFCDLFAQLLNLLVGGAKSSSVFLQQRQAEKGFLAAFYLDLSPAELRSAVLHVNNEDDSRRDKPVVELTSRLKLV